MDPLLRTGTRTSFRRRSRRTVYLHGARGEEATGSDGHLEAGIVAIPGHSASLASTSGVPCRLGAPTDHPGPAAPPTLPYGAGVGGQGPPAAEVESPPSRASLNHQSSKDDSQLHNSCRQGWDLMTQHPHKRHRHCRDSGRIERTTEFQPLPPAVEATIHAHCEDNKPLTPPQEIRQPDRQPLEQALRANLGQSCPPRAQSSSAPSTKLVPGAKRAAADLSKRERARGL